MGLKQWIGRIVTGFGGLALAVSPVAAKAPAVPTEAHPALWAVSDPDTTIYLFGTIHLLPPNIHWRTPVFDQALAKSDELVLETILDDKDPSKAIAAFSSLAFAKGLPPLLERVPAAKRKAVSAAIAESGYPVTALDGMKTWAAAFILLGGQFKDLGVEAGEGVETILRGDFTAKGKKIGELETNVEQYGYFDRLSENAQRALLEGSIEQHGDVQKVFDSMLGAWASGETRTIARTFNEELKDSPELREHVIAERNGHWADWIGHRLDQPGTLLVAVGAGHLAGPGSVVDALEKRGFTVRRLQ